MTFNHDLLKCVTLRGKTRIFCESCGCSGHNYDSWIIIGPNLFISSIFQKNNKYNEDHVYNTKDPPKEWTINTPVVNLNSQTSSTSISTEKNIFLLYQPLWEYCIIMNVIMVMLNIILMILFQIQNQYYQLRK